MNHKTFWELVEKYFHFLPGTYGFSVKDFYDPQYETFSVAFTGNNILISFGYDRGDLYIEITNLLDDQRRGHDPATLIEFLEPRVYAEFRAKGRSKLPDAPIRRIENELSFWAPLIQQHLKPILGGEFNRWDELNQFENKLLAIFKQDELPRVLEEINAESSNNKSVN